MRAHYEYPIPAVGVAVWKGDRVLLIQRGKPPYHGSWTIPGGAVERGETLVEAARREIQEECGIAIRNLQFLTYVDLLDYAADGQLAYHYIALEMLAFWHAGTPQAADDAMTVGWFTRDQWPTLNLTDALLKVLEQAWQVVSARAM